MWLGDRSVATAGRLSDSAAAKDRRRYAAVEAAKLGYGGPEYVCAILRCHPNTVRQGREDVAMLPQDEIQLFSVGPLRAMLRIDDIDIYLSGKLLYGDDFSHSQIAEWYANEKEGYADLGAKDTTSYRYEYHAWNTFHAYRHLPGGFSNVMGFGSAYGDELLPIISRIGMVTIVDPSDAFVRETVHGVPARYIKPTPDGRLRIADDTFDLITCLGVLHHIPNVSFVVSELSRVLKPGGHVVLREPIISMEDWRTPRRGLTKRERGIPLRILGNIVRASGLDTVRQSLCGFPLTVRMFRMIRSDVYNSSIATKVDALLSWAFGWNVNYHARNALDRLRPTSTFLILRKPEAQPGAPAKWGETMRAEVVPCWLGP